MSFTNFIPEIWSASILSNFHNRGVLVDLANREYEAELTHGQTIHIPGIVDVEIKDYKANGRTTTPDVISDTGVDLTIDQEKNFDFIVDDIDRAQSKYTMDAYTESAAYGLVDDAEEFLTAQLVTGGTAVAGAGEIGSYKEAYGAIMKVRRALNDAHVPMGGRKLVINSAMEEILLSEDGKLTAADTSGSSAGFREATIGRLLGFDVVVNQYATEAKPQAIGLLPSALAYVSQIRETEALRAEKKFADRLRGLHVYGGKVIRPSAVQVYTSTPGMP